MWLDVCKWKTLYPWFWHDSDGIISGAHGISGRTGRQTLPAYPTHLPLATHTCKPLPFPGILPTALAVLLLPMPPSPPICHFTTYSPCVEINNMWAASSLSFFSSCLFPPHTRLQPPHTAPYALTLALALFAHMLCFFCTHLATFYTHFTPLHTHTICHLLT